MDYDKPEVKKSKKSRYLAGGGPRDQQRRLALMDAQKRVAPLGQEDLIRELRDHIATLNEKLAEKEQVTGEYSAFDVDKEIRKAVAGAVEETKEKFKNKIKSLKSNNDKLISEVEELKKLIKIKDETIKSLEISMKSSSSNNNEALEKMITEQNKQIEILTAMVAEGRTFESSNERPQMEEVFIDPLDKDAGKDIESHMKVKDTSSEKKEDIGRKANKLKSVLGGLPSINK
jgi:hypothetical protein